MTTITRDPDVLDDWHYKVENEEVTADEKVTFALDGKTYTLDLTKENADRFRTEVKPWVDIAEPVRAQASAGRSSSRHASTGRPERELTAKIREWAASQKIELSDRGRIPNEVREQYFAAHPGDRPAT